MPAILIYSMLACCMLGSVPDELLGVSSSYFGCVCESRHRRRHSIQQEGSVALL